MVTWWVGIWGQVVAMPFGLLDDVIMLRVLHQSGWSQGAVGGMGEEGLTVMIL